jgi:hypothetical protein
MLRLSWSLGIFDNSPIQPNGATMTTLLDLIPLLEAMPHDDIRDWIDYVDYYHLSKLITDDTERQTHYIRVRNRRIGLPTGSFPDPFFPPKTILRMRTRYQQAAEELLTELDEFNQKVALAMAQSLHRLKAPIHRTSTGNIEVKWIPYEYIDRDPETGEPRKDENGQVLIVYKAAPYLYLRYWQVLGDKERTKRRVKSIYIGGQASGGERVSGEYQYPYRALADYFYDLLQTHGIERTRTNKQTGEIMTYRVRPAGNDNPIAEFEARILDCIDMSQVEALGSDAIDHECLEALQAELPS